MFLFGVESRLVGIMVERLVLDTRRRISHIDIGNRVRPAGLADQ